jgi:hypothetical protein
MRSLLAITLLLACSKKQEAPPPPPRPKAAKIEALALKPLPDKKLEVTFRVLDTEGKPMKAWDVGYKVLGCDAGASIRDENFDKDLNVKLVAELEFCGRPAADNKVSLDLRVGELHATADVDAKAAYVRNGPRSLDELPTELGRLETAGMSDGGPFTAPNPNIGLFDLVVDRIVEMEAPAVPKLVEVWKSDPKQVRQRAAAAAIAALDSSLLVKDTIALLDKYDEERAADEKAWNGQTARAAAAGVYAAERLKAAVAADVHFRALSSIDPTASEMAAKWIKAKLERDVAVDALFRYMAAKQSYSQREVDIYVSVIEQFGNEASASVAKNLDALLAAAKKPDKVFWAHKVVGLTALEKIGQADAAPTIKKFKADKGTYVFTKQPLDEMGNPKGVAERTDIAFATLADKALAAIEKR